MYVRNGWQPSGDRQPLQHALNGTGLEQNVTRWTLGRPNMVPCHFVDADEKTGHRGAI